MLDETVLLDLEAGAADHSHLVGVVTGMELA